MVLVLVVAGLSLSLSLSLGSLDGGNTQIKMLVRGEKSERDQSTNNGEPE